MEPDRVPLDLLVLRQVGLGLRLGEHLGVVCLRAAASVEARARRKRLGMTYLQARRRLIGPLGAQFCAEAFHSA